MSIPAKILALMGARALIGQIKNIVTRWVVKYKFTRGELPVGTWYSPKFLIELGIERLFWLGVIASFTAVTFPIGMQLSSYKLDDAFPLTRIMTGVISLVVIPIGFWTAHSVIGEMPINRMTLTGLGVCMVSYLLLIAGGWLMLKGGQA